MSRATPGDNTVRYPNGQPMPATAPLLALRDMILGGMRGAARTATTWPGDLEKLAAQFADHPQLSSLVTGAKPTKTLFPTGEDFDKLVPAAPNSNAGKGYKNDGTMPFEKLAQFAPVSPQQLGRGALTALKAAAKAPDAAIGALSRLGDIAATAAHTPTYRAGQEGAVRLSGDLTNNASGESAASQEAVNRLASENAAGRDMLVVHADGTHYPLPTADRVDYQAPAGATVVQRGVGADPNAWTVRNAGQGANTQQALNIAGKWRPDTTPPQETGVWDLTDQNLDPDHYAAGGLVLPAGITAANIARLEQSRGLPAGLLTAVLHAESNGNPNAVSPKGAQGVAQLMPKTAKMLGVDPFNAKEAVVGAADYLGQLLQQFKGNVPTTLAAWNWGPGNVARKGVENAPEETRKFITKVIGRPTTAPEHPPTAAAPTNVVEEPEEDYGEIINALLSPHDQEPMPEEEV